MNDERRRVVNPLPRWQRRVLAWSGLALLATGLAWLPLHHLLGTGAGELPHPFEPLLMRAHGLAAVAATFGLGLVGAAHVARGWRAGPARRISGAALAAGAALLVASGWVLHEVAPEDWRDAIGWAHAAVGAAATIAWTLHRRTRAGCAAAPPTP